MSIAKNLGVDDIDGPLMIAARAAWPSWVRDVPKLGVVDDLLDLPKWLRSAAPADRDGRMSGLGTLAATDSNAAVAMAWLLIPGVKRLGSKLRDLADDIDGLVAGQPGSRSANTEGRLRRRSHRPSSATLSGPSRPSAVLATTARGPTRLGQ